MDKLYLGAACYTLPSDKEHLIKDPPITELKSPRVWVCAAILDAHAFAFRFELPYNIWCGGCGSHVGMGVRYNAEKTTVGKYYSTPIFKFRMKCHLCDNHFEIQTDPKVNTRD